MNISEQNEKKIDGAREAYRSCARRASVLFFAANDLSLMDPMYQFSLDWYLELFNKSINHSKKSESVYRLVHQLIYL